MYVALDKTGVISIKKWQKNIMEVFHINPEKEITGEKQLKGMSFNFWVNLVSSKPLHHFYNHVVHSYPARVIWLWILTTQQWFICRLERQIGMGRAVQHSYPACPSGLHSEALTPYCALRRERWLQINFMFLMQKCCSKMLRLNAGPTLWDHNTSVRAQVVGS